MDSERTLAAVEAVIDLAKLESSDLMPVSQSLYFNNQLIDKDAFRMLEVPSELADRLEVGSELVIRGEDNDSAVLCTDRNTYDMRDAETSNGFALLEGISFAEGCNANGNTFLKCTQDKNENNRILQNVRINGVLNKYLELTPCPPKVAKIRSLLQQAKAQYSALDSKWNPKVGIAISELKDRVQCSSYELEKALNELQAIRVSKKNNNIVDYSEERVFMLKNDYKMKVLTFITSFIQRDFSSDGKNENDNSGSIWEKSDIDRSRCIKMCSYEDEPPYLVEQIFDYFFTPNEFSCTIEDKGSRIMQKSIGYKICKNKVFRFYGECLFPEERHQQCKYNTDEFCNEWQRSINLQFGSDLENSFGVVDPTRDLSGIALLDRKENKVEWYPEWKLPLDIQERFKVLFKHRERWNLQDITPYLEKYTTPKVKAYALITKYCRVISARDGSKLFCSKYGK